MRGHIKTRSKGSWTIVLDLGRDPATGKRKQQWTTVRGTKKQAEQKLAELQHEMATGGYINPTKEKLGTFLKRWMDDNTRLRPTTRESYRQRAKHLIDDLGHIPISELKPQQIHQYYREKGKTL